MKTLITLIAFTLTLALTSKSLASDSSHGGGSAEAGHGNLAEKMNALFPEPHVDPALRAVPAKPELVSPAYFTSIADSKASLQWKAVVGADVYHVQVATDSNFKWLVANEQAVTATNFEVSSLEAGKHYFWRVAAVKSNNWQTFRKSYFATSMFATPGATAK